MGEGTLNTVASHKLHHAPFPLLSRAFFAPQDNFDVFNLSTWKHELTLSGDENWCFEWYNNNRSVSFVRNGTLVISPVRTIESVNILNADLSIWGGDPAIACTNNFDYGCERAGGANIINPITSASLRTAESLSFRYGRVEIVAQLPRGDWLWPALWMMPVHAGYGGWPTSGEIDIMESRGNARGYAAGGVESIGSTYHFGPYCCDDGYATAHAEYALPAGDFSQGFHTFGMLWTPTLMQTYVDNVTVLSLPINETFFARGGFSPSIDNPWRGGAENAPFDQRFYLKMNVAVGGTNGYFPDGVGNKPWAVSASERSALAAAQVCAEPN